MSLLYVYRCSSSASGAVHFTGMRPFIHMKDAMFMTCFNNAYLTCFNNAYLRTFSVVVLTAYVPSHAKVGYFKYESFRNQNISCCKVTVHNLVRYVSV